MTAVADPTWTLVGRVEDIPYLEGRSVTVQGRRIAIFRLPSGLAAIYAHCPHAAGPLADGIVADSCVTCPLHGRRFDLHTGTLKPYFPGPGRALQEPVFIPSSARGAEGEGYVVAVGHNIAQSTTELYLLDALRMEELARVTLPFRTAPQVHGVWGDPTTLPLQ